MTAVKVDPALADALAEPDLAVLRQLIADALDYRREHEDGECADCERGDCPVTSEDARRTRAYLIFRNRFGLGGAG